MTDYSRFYLSGSDFLGHQLYCLDCDGPDDKLPWLTDDPTMDLGEMVTMADEHCARVHPDGQPDPGPEPEPGGVEWLTVPFQLPGTHAITRTPEFTGVLSYLEVV